MLGKNKNHEDEKKEPEGTELSREAQVEKLAGEIQVYDERIESFQKDLPKLEGDLKDEDRLIAQKVSEALDEFPNSTPKGLLDKIYKLSLPKRGQLKESLNKLEIAVAHTQAKRKKLVVEKVTIEKAIEEERLLEEARGLFSKMLEIIEMNKKTEHFFDGFKDEIAGASEHWALKAEQIYKAEGWSRPLMQVLMTIADSHLRRAALDGLSLSFFIESCASVSSSSEYEPNPLQLEKDITRQKDKIRSVTSPEYPDTSLERVDDSAEAGGDRAADERLQEIFNE